MGLLPEQVRQMTPAETDLLVEGWNRAQSGKNGPPPAMSLDRLEELERLHG
jgi:hypothetical protein